MPANDSLIEEFPDVAPAPASGIEEFPDTPSPDYPVLSPGYSTEVARGLTQWVPALAKTTSTAGDKLGNLVRAGVGLGPLPETLVPPEERPLYKAGEWMQRKLDDAYPATPEADRNIGHDVAQGLGQMGSMVAGGAAARGAGATVKGAGWLATLMGSVQEFDDAFSRSRQRGDDPDTAFAKSLGYATVAGLIENKLGAGRILRKYFPDPALAAQKLSAWGVSKAVAGSLAVGFGEEGSQRFAQNWIVEGKPSLEGVVQEGAPGGIVQAIAELPATLLRAQGGRIRRPKLYAQPETEEPNAATRVETSVEVGEEKPPGLVQTVPAGTSREIQNPTPALSQGQRAEAQPGVVPIIPRPRILTLERTRKLAALVKAQEPLPASEIDEFSLRIPPGYVRKGNQFVFTPTTIEAEVARQKLLENMLGRTVNVLPSEMDAPSAHLKSIFGENAPTWRQLMDAGLLETTTPGAPARPGDVGLVITQAAQLPENIGGTLGVASENLPPDAQAIEAANKAKQRQIAEDFKKANALKETGAAPGATLTPVSVEPPAAVTPVETGIVDTIAGKMGLTEFEKKGYAPEQVTQADWVNLQRAERRRLGQSEQSGPPAAPFQDYKSFHEDAVRRAFGKGETVDPEVLADYPDIKPETKPAAPVATPTPATPVAETKAVSTKAEKELLVSVSNQSNRRPYVPLESAELDALVKAGDVHGKGKRKGKLTEQGQNKLAEYARQERVAANEEYRAAMEEPPAAAPAQKAETFEQRMAREEDVNDWIKSSLKSKRPPANSEEAWNQFTAFDRARGVEVTGKDYFVSAWETFQPAQKPTAPASDVSPKQSETKPITIDAALNLAEQRKAEGKSRLSVAQELSGAGLSDGDATGIAGQVFAPKASEAPASDLFPDLKGKAPTLERVRNAIVEAESDLEAKTEVANDENIRSDHPIHVEVDLAQKRVDKLRALGQRLEQTAIQKPQESKAVSEKPTLLEYAKRKLPKATAEKITSESQVESYRAQWEKDYPKPTPPETGGDAGLQIPFRDIGPGHAKFDDGLKLLVEARSLTDERAEILRDLFRDTDDAYLGRFTIEPRTMRAVGWARWQGKEGDNRKAWLKLKRGLADLTDTSKEGFWAESSHEPIVVFAHEYAHVAEYLLLTDADRALVKEAFQRLKASGRIVEFFGEGLAGSNASAKYYAKNWKEFLSESFAEYVMSKKVPVESMRPILTRLYDAFKSAVARVFQRGAKGETAMLEPLYEKMLRGGEISEEGPTGEAMASGGAPAPTGDARARDEEGVRTQVQGVKNVGIEREAENIEAIQETIRRDIFNGTQAVTDAATAEARALFGRMTDPNQKAGAAGEILTKTNAQMGPGLVLTELWNYANRMVLTKGDDSFLREIVPHYQDFDLGGGGSTAFGRGLRALREGGPLFKQLWEIERESRAAAGQKMAVGPELLDALIERMKGAIPEAAAVQTEFDAQEQRRAPTGAIRAPRNIGTLVEAIRNSPYLSQSDPAWRYETAIKWFQANGMDAEQADQATVSFTAAFDKAFAAALEREARAVLGKKTPPNKIEEIVRAIRAGVTDPARALLNHFATLAGFKPATAAQHARLAELDQKLADPDLSPPERAQVVEQMDSIFRHMTLPPSLLTKLSANFVATLLTGFKTFTVNIFAPPVRLLTERVALSFTNPRDFTTHWKSLAGAWSNWIREAQLTATDDVVSFLNNDYRGANNVLKRMWEDGVADMRSGDPKRQVKGLWQLMSGAQQYSMRMLNAADQANMITEREAMLALYGSAVLRRAGLGTREVQIMVQAMSRIKRELIQDGLGKGMKPSLARVRADALLADKLQQFVNGEISEQAGDEFFEAMHASELDAYSSTGRLGMTDGGDQMKETDEGGVLSRVILHHVLEWSSKMRSKPGSGPAVAVALLGYLNIPIRTARFYAWNAPFYGLFRMGIHKFRKYKGWDNWWKQTLATEVQERHRMKMAVASTVAFSIVTGVGLALAKTSADDDAGEDELGVYITGDGPKNKNLKDAWTRRGFQQQSIVMFLNKKPIRVPLTRLGEPLAHILWFLSARDDWQWRKKEAEAAGRPFKEPPSETVMRGIGTYAGLLGQRGPLQNISQWARLGSGEGGTTKLLAAQTTRLASAAVTPFLGLQNSISSMIYGPIENASLEAAIYSNLPVLGLFGEKFRKQQVNRFGDPLYDQSWYAKMSQTGIPIAFRVSDTLDNKMAYSLLTEKGAAPPVLRRYIVEEKYGPLTNDQYEQFAEKSGRLLKQQLVRAEPSLRAMPPESVKKWLNKTTASTDKQAAVEMNLEPVKPPRAVAGGAGPISEPRQLAQNPRISAAAQWRSGRAPSAPAYRPVSFGRSRTKRPTFRSYASRGRTRIRRPRLLASRRIRRPRFYGSRVRRARLSV